MSLAVVVGQRIAKHHQILTSALFVAALIVVAIFPSFDRRTEVEEHGLIPGYATNGLDARWQARLRECIAQIEAETDIRTAIEASLQKAGLQPYHMNFSLPEGGQSSLLYTVAESRRGDSRESLVLMIASNWTMKKSTAKSSWGIGIGVTLARYFRTVHWLSRDVLVVFVDSNLAYGAGARAWLRAYIEGHSELRRGALRQAVILQVKNGATSLLMDVEGINGMVPNQDLVNTYSITARERPGLVVRHRDAWESVMHHARNGGVHTSHAAFLELQVPAFTIRGVSAKGDRSANLNVDSLAMSIESLVRCMSNALQQLHHSFNFYFFTGPNSHISNGLYLYPVFAMHCLLISFLGTTPPYRDIRSLLVGLGVVAAIAGVSGSTMFALAMNDELLAKSLSFSEKLACIRPEASLEAALQRRQIAGVWVLAGAGVSAIAALALRNYAFSVFSEDAQGPAVKSSGVRLPCPLWESVRVACGFALLAVLAPVTIYSWALAMPLTIVCVPALVLVRPVDMRRRPLRSTLILAFLAGNVFLLAVPPDLRATALGDAPRLVGDNMLHLYERSLVPAVPREAQKYLPRQLVQWLQQGQLAQAFRSDMLLLLYEAARDFKCVGGMLFPVICFAYWPLLVLLALIACILPAQRVQDEALSLSQLRLQALLVLALVMGGIVGGVVWRSYSSHGLEQLRW
ncbi:Gpaa1 [Symbiodinium sp. CCMP2592]|nr:Gpaa1 [Symbiodinium sp. CCMP2592]